MLTLDHIKFELDQGSPSNNWSCKVIMVRVRWYPLVTNLCNVRFIIFQKGSWIMKWFQIGKWKVFIDEKCLIMFAWTSFAIVHAQISKQEVIFQFYKKNNFDPFSFWFWKLLHLIWCLIVKIEKMLQSFQEAMKIKYNPLVECINSRLGIDCRLHIFKIFQSF